MSYDFDHVIAAQGEWDSRRDPTGTPAAIPLGQVTPCFFNGLVLATIYAILMDRL
jgi:hypothetical protein